jgi:hypothetical protein
MTKIIYAPFFFPSKMMAVPLCTLFYCHRLANAATIKNEYRGATHRKILHGGVNNLCKFYSVNLEGGNESTYSIYLFRRAEYKKKII